MSSADGVRTSLAGMVASVTSMFRRQRTTGSAIPSNSNTPPDLTQFAPVFEPSGGLFSPGYPLNPIEREKLRAFDYPVGYNYIFAPRSFEPISFRELRSLAHEPITRLCIETRKDQIEALNWTIKPINERKPKAGAEDRAQTLIKFFLKPDGYHPFATWLRLLIEDVLVTDAPAVEVRRNRRGDIIALDVIDGSTIKVLLDDNGRRPLPPAPAYEQIIHGRPWVLAEEGRVSTGDRGKPLFDAQIIYMPRNPRGGKCYGHSVCEQILLIINTALRRETMQLAHFTQSNIPAGMATSPEGWSVDQVKRYQDWFDSILSGNLGERTKILWGPAGAKYQLFREPPFKDDFDEWLARIVSFAFSLPPTWAVRQVNRATAEQAQEVALEEGLAPLMGWVKRLMDTIVQDRMGHPDLEFAWSNKRPIDPLDQQKMLGAYVENGVLTRDEARDQLGMNPIPGGENATVAVPGKGVILVRDLKRIRSQPGNGTAKISKALLTKGNPANSLVVRLAAAKLKAKIAKFFAAEVLLVAAEILHALDKAKDDNDDHDDADTADHHKDQHWLEALIAAILLAIDFSRWKVLIISIAPILSNLGADVFADAANEVDASNIAADGKPWAEAFARDRAAALVGRRWSGAETVDDPDANESIVASTKNMLEPVIERAVKEGMDLAALKTALRQSIFSRDRSERIGDFETRNVFHAAVLQAFKASGKVDTVRWVTVGDDKVEAVCQQNAAAGPVPLGQPFPSGHISPLAHPQCRCWLQAV